MYLNQTLQNYTDDLAAKLSVPGGGSASALVASLGISLISMVVNFTLGKAKYQKYQKQLKEILFTSERLRKRFLALVDLDVRAYQSKDFKKSAGVPFEMAGLCFKGIQLCPNLLKKGNLNLASDVACAAVLLEAAFTGAYFNVEINLKNLKDISFANKMRKTLQKKAKIIKKIRKNTEAGVGKIIRRKNYCSKN